MDIKAKDNLFKALGVFIEAFRMYVVSKLIQIAGDKWEDQFKQSMYSDQIVSWEEYKKQGSEAKNLIDFHHLKGFALKFKEQLKDDFDKKANSLPTWFEEIADVRHKCNHYQELVDEEVSRAYSNMLMIAKYLKMDELESEITLLRDNKIQVQSIKHTGTTSRLPWFKIIKPHMDIRQGTLDESVFAANLAEVAHGTGREVYKSAPVFFSKTYFTVGLKNIAKRVIKGLNGGQDAENRVVSLQTGFGGGKTHTLITLYHIASLGDNLLDSHYTKELIDYTGMPEFKKASIAVFTNTTNDPVQGRIVDGIHIHTLWGELAYQLGGKEAYEIIKENDIKKVAPKGLFKKVLEKTKPALILIDELADYCISASGITVGGNTLSDQTISFIQELSEAVSGTDKCVLVATLPASVTEVTNSAKGEQILSSLSSRLGRVGADSKPVSDSEIYEVIRRRLFEDIDMQDDINKAIDDYMNLYTLHLLEIPDNARQTQYKEKMIKSYPFHPELIDMFRVRWASNHDFQRTRGVLRLLASIISDLWKRQNSLVGSHMLIHTSDVNFENLDALSGQLKKLYGSGYEAVISADVSGSSSNAFKIDNEKTEYGNYNLTQGIASTILLGSFGGSGLHNGISVQDIKLCILKPDSFNHNNVNGALDVLEDRAHYLYSTSLGSEYKRYWFHTKPNINILINQAKGNIKKEEIEAEILKRINDKVSKVQRFKVLIDPIGEIPEQKEPTIVILGAKYLANPDHINGNAKKMIEYIATKKGNNERIYRNTFIFLICSEISIGQLNSDIKDYLSCIKIREEYPNLENDQKDDLKKKIEEFSKKADSSLVVAYSIVAKYSAIKGIDKILINQFKDSLDTQININIWDTLKNEEWILETVGLGLLRNNNLLPTPQKSIKVKDIYETFVRYDDKPMIIGSESVRQSLLRYCMNGEFVIGCGDGNEFKAMYYKQNVPFFEVLDDTYWVMDKSVYKQPESYNGAVTNEQPKQTPTVEQKISDTNQENIGGIKPINRITIKGKIGLENYNQIFTSFIQPLVNNYVEIRVEISGKSTITNPISNISQQYKITKESARQLGMEFEEE